MNEENQFLDEFKTDEGKNIGKLGQTATAS